MRGRTEAIIGAAVVVALGLGTSGCVVGYAPDGSDPNETTGPDRSPPDRDAAYLPMDAGMSFPGDDAWVMPTPDIDAWVMPTPEVDAYVPPGHDAGHTTTPDAWVPPAADAYVCPTWAGSIHTLLDQHCGDCHTTQRPAFVNSQSSARTNYSAIISAGTPPGSMSYRDPLGGFSADDDGQIRAWIACGAP